MGTTTRLGLLLAFVVSSASLGAASAVRTIPMSGTVVDTAAFPVADVDVVLSRQAKTSTGSEQFSTIGHARTDAAGHFSFGAVDLQSEVAFPLETSVSFEYHVQGALRSRRVVNISFTAPRSQPDLAIQSVEAKLVVQ